MCVSNPTSSHHPSENECLTFVILTLLNTWWRPGAVPVTVCSYRCWQIPWMTLDPWRAVEEMSNINLWAMITKTTPSREKRCFLSCWGSTAFLHRPFTGINLEWPSENISVGKTNTAVQEESLNTLNNNKHTTQSYVPLANMDMTNHLQPHDDQTEYFTKIPSFNGKHWTEQSSALRESFNQLFTSHTPTTPASFQIAASLWCYWNTFIFRLWSDTVMISLKYTDRLEAFACLLLLSQLARRHTSMFLTV